MITRLRSPAYLQLPAENVAARVAVSGRVQIKRGCLIEHDAYEDETLTFRLPRRTMLWVEYH